MAIVIVSKSLGIGPYMTSLVKKNCSDALTQSAMVDFENRFNNEIRPLDLIVFLIILFYLILQYLVFAFFWYKITERKRKNY